MGKVFDYHCRDKEKNKEAMGNKAKILSAGVCDGQ